MAYEEAIIIGFQFAAFCMFYLAFKFSEKHTPMQILFSLVGLWLTLTNLTVMQIIADDNTQTAISSLLQTVYGAVLLSIIFFMGYIIVMFFWETFHKTSRMN